MFAANAKLTGKAFNNYDGNPHSFGHDCDDFNGAKRSKAFVAEMQARKQREKEMSVDDLEAPHSAAPSSAGGGDELAPAFAALLASAGPAGGAGGAPPGLGVLDDGRLQRLHELLPSPPSGAAPRASPPGDDDGMPIRRLESLEDIEATARAAAASSGGGGGAAAAHHLETADGADPPPLLQALLARGSPSATAPPPPPAAPAMGLDPGADVPELSEFEFDLGDILSTISPTTPA